MIKVHLVEQLIDSLIDRGHELALVLAVGEQLDYRLYDYFELLLVDATVIINLETKLFRKIVCSLNKISRKSSYVIDLEDPVKLFREVRLLNE